MNCYHDFLKKIDWTTIFASVLSSLFVGLAVGIIVAHYGHKLWRKQYFYDKKVSTYFDLKVQLEKLVIPFIIQRSVFVTKEELSEIKAIIKSIEIQISTIKHFLGSSFAEDVESLINIMKNPKEENFLVSVKKAYKKIDGITNFTRTKS